MNILLINPSNNFENRYGSLKSVAPTQAPLGLAYIAAVIIQKRKDVVKILDAENYQLSIKNISQYVKKHNFDVIGITLTTPGYYEALKIIRKISEVHKCLIIAGGPHMTVMPIETLKDNPSIDIGVLGEGELTIVEILNKFEAKKSFNNVKGIAYRQGKNIIINTPREHIKNLDNIPFPTRHLLPMKRYRPAPTYYKKLPSYAILGARGCPFRCSYCSRAGFSKSYRHHSIDRICSEIEHIITSYKAKEIIFRDDSFTIKRAHIINLCKELIKRNINNKIKWSCETRVNLVDYELLKVMKKAGCWQIHFGVESASQRLLDLVQKDIKINDVKNAFKMCKNLKISIKAFFMIGLPTENRQDSLNTIKFAKELDPDWVQFTITTPYPGTKLYELCKQSGKIKNFNWSTYKSWSGFTDSPLPYVAKGRSEKELKNLQKRALREFYFRPKVMFRILKNMSSLDALKYCLKGFLALIGF